MTREKLSVDCFVSEAQWRRELPEYQTMVERVIRHLLQNEILELPLNRQIEVSVTLTNDAEIQDLNSSYRDQNKPTNVLSFPTYEASELADLAQLPLPVGMPLVLGDIIMAFETTRREAELENKAFRDHFTHLLLHGCLHLLGFDHETEEEAEVMETLETQLLEELGIANPYESGL